LLVKSHIANLPMSSAVGMTIYIHSLSKIV
jgi:hypothetical protein